MELVARDQQPIPDRKIGNCSNQNASINLIGPFKFEGVLAIAASHGNRAMPGMRESLP